MKPKPIAIVGMACRLPMANDLDEFWNLLIQGKNAIGPIPSSRFDRDLYFDPKKGVIGRSYSDKAALIDLSDVNVPGGCITADDIENYAPAHILFCRVVENALRHAKILPASLQKESVGVFVGHSASGGLGSDYTYGLHIAQIAEYLLEDDSFIPPAPWTRESLAEALVENVRSQYPRRTPQHNPHLLPSDMVRLVTSKFRLNGPGMVFNSACASSSQAIGHGMKALQLGRIDTAIVGGASFFLSDTIILFSAAQSLSANGSYPFTDKADGLIPGEGYVVFLLKTLEKALRDGDEIHAILPSVGVSSDGGGASLWAPRKEGQIEAIRRAYDNGIGIGSLDYIEGHATSTNLGDKTELNALSELLNEAFPAGKRIPIGCVKRNIGHTLEVAGAAGLLKTILAMKHETIPASVSPNDTLSKNIKWSEIPLYPPSRNLPWPRHADGTPRRAGVNAFGIGGLNIHLVVEDYCAKTTAPTEASKPLSVKTNDNEDRSVAVIGIGLVLPGALNWEQFQSLQQTRKRRLAPLPQKPWNAAMFSDRERWGDYAVDIPGGGVVEGFQYDWKRHKVPPKQIASASPLQFMMLDAVDQAIAQAGYGTEKTLNRLKTGCLVGTSFADDFATQLVMGLRLPETCRTIKELIRQNASTISDADMETWSKNFTARVLRHMPALVDETGSFTASALASRITKTYNLMGGGGAVDAGIGSAANALIASLDLLLTGACDTMICIAGQHGLSPGAFQEWSFSGRIADSLDFKSPYDGAAKGTLPAEGCVALILKRLDDARRDNDPIFGVIRGAAAAYRPELENAVAESVKKALDDASLPATMVRSFETVGAGVGELDSAELNGLATAYSDLFSTGHTLPVGTPTAQLGHLGAASTLVSLIVGMAALNEEKLPPTIAFSTLSPAIREAGGFSFSDNPQRLGTDDSEGRLVMGVNSCSEFGTSFHVLLQRPEPVKPSTPPCGSTTTKTTTPARNEPLRNVLTGSERISAGIVHFDATCIRRERLRKIAETKIVSSGQEPPKRDCSSQELSPTKFSGKAATPKVLPVKITVLPHSPND